MDKKLKFADYLNLLIGTREKQILHDLSNKFNLLTLAIEDLEDTLDETSSEGHGQKEALASELSSLKVAKNKFQELVNQMKEEASFKKTSLSIIWETLNSCHQKELRKKSIELEVILDQDREVPFTSAFNLLNGAILLRIHLCANQKLSLNLNDEKQFYDEERKLLAEQKSLVEDRFAESYLNLISSWQRDSLF